MLSVEQQIEELKNSIRRHIQEEFNFQPMLWERLNLTRNCFTYALNIRDGKIERSLLSNYGKIVNKPSQIKNITIDEAYDITIKTLKVLYLDFKECEFETEVPDGYFKVAWYLSHRDLHWLRRDNNGTWSHKQGWYFSPTNIDSDGNPILNPATAKIELVPGDKFVQIRYFLISKNYQG